MEFRQLVTFLEVSQYKNFSQAAQALGYSQSTVTIQIQQLEEELGVRLFDRIGRKVSLTEKGAALVDYANSIIDQVNQAKSLMNPALAAHSTLRIGTIESLCFLQFGALVQEMRRLHPNLSIEVSIASPEKLLKQMDQGELDLVYILDEPRYSSSWKKVLDQPEEIVFVASPDLELGGNMNPDSHSDSRRDPNQPISVTDLLEYPFYLTEKKVNYRRALDQYLAGLSRELTPVLEAPNTEFLINIVQQMKGISFLPLFSAEAAIRQGTLKRVTVDDFQLQMSRQLLYHKNKWVTEEMKDCIQYLSEARFPMNIS